MKKRTVLMPLINWGDECSKEKVVRVTDEF